MSLLNRPRQGTFKPASWAKWDDTAQKWVTGHGHIPERFYFWLGAAAETL